MHKNGTICFAVIYIPFYALQCARQKCVLERSALENRQSDDEAEPRVGDEGADDDTSSNCPAALLDHDGMHVIELNQAAEYAGIQPGMSTSQALARASELILYKRSPSDEQHLQDTLLQLVYRYSPLIENSAPGICTLDLKGKRVRNHPLWLGELLAQLRSIGLKAQAGIGLNPEIALQAAKIADPILEISEDSHLLQSLALESLAPSPFLLDILKSWGVRTLGALTRLPREEIGQRLAAGHLFPALLEAHDPSRYFYE